MPRITIHQETLRVQMNWIETVFAFRRSFEIPLSHVQNITRETMSLKTAYKGIRHPGTHIPGLYAAGTN